MDETFDDYLDETGNITIPEGRTLVDYVEKHTFVVVDPTTPEG